MSIQLRPACLASGPDLSRELFRLISCQKHKISSWDDFRAVFMMEVGILAGFGGEQGAILQDWGYLVVSGRLLQNVQ